MSKIATLQTIQMQDLDRVIATLQDNVKRVLDLLTSNPLANVRVVQVNFPDSAHPTVHADGTTGYDVLVAHGMKTRMPMWFPTAILALPVVPPLTTPYMAYAVVAQSPDNTALNRTPGEAILLTCGQPSVQAQIVFF